MEFYFKPCFSSLSKTMWKVNLICTLLYFDPGATNFLSCMKIIWRREKKICTGPVSKYFWHFHLCSFCCNYSTLSLQCISKLWPKECTCVPIKFYLWALKFEFHVGFLEIKHYFSLIFFKFKNAETVLSLGAIQNMHWTQFGAQFYSLPNFI